VEEGFRTIADAVKLPDRKQSKADIPHLVYNWLSSEQNGRWTMVLDSADDGDVFDGPTSGDTCNGKPFKDYLPQSRNGSIIITTRNKDLARRLTGSDKNILEVGAMAPADALLLLEKKSGPLSDVDTSLELVQVLDCVPLAISQAAAYIQARAPRSSVEKYLAEFREGERKRARLLGYDGGDLRRDGSASNAVLTTWQISFEYIRGKRPSAAELLSLMSFFDRQGIPESLLKSSRDAQESDEEEDSDKKEDSKSDRLFDSEFDSESDGGGGEAEDTFEEDVGMLRDYCLVSVNKDGDVFEMHRLVQLSMRRWLKHMGYRRSSSSSSWDGWLMPSRRGIIATG